MTEKGILKCKKVDGINVYNPLSKREDAVKRETRDFLRRVYKGSVSMMVSALTEKMDLSQEEINELHAILRQLIPVNCGDSFISEGVNGVRLEIFTYGTAFPQNPQRY